jgi:SAM-dependent methyltransferase
MLSRGRHTRYPGGKTVPRTRLSPTNRSISLPQGDRKMRDLLVKYLVSKKGFSYYPSDKYLIRKILTFAQTGKPKVLDAGCGNGHYSFLFEKYGADVTGFDINGSLIENALQMKEKNNSAGTFMVADAQYPEVHFGKNQFDIVFMSGLSLFGTSFDSPLMKKYVSLLSPKGKLVFTHNSNLDGTIRSSMWKNYSLDELVLKFEELPCVIEEIYFYDRHISQKLFHSLVFTTPFKYFHIFLTKITKIPFNIVLIISRGNEKQNH